MLYGALLAFDVRKLLRSNDIPVTKDVMIRCVRHTFVHATPHIVPLVVVVCSNDGGRLMWIPYIVAYIGMMIYTTYDGYNESFSKSGDTETEHYELVFSLFLICTNKTLLCFEMIAFYYLGFFVGKIIQKLRGVDNSTDTAAAAADAPTAPTYHYTFNNNTAADATSAPIYRRYRRRRTNNNNNPNTATTNPTNRIDVLVHDETCAICTEVTTGNNLAVLPCRHAFHLNCMLQHVENSYTLSPSSCPMCRSPIPSSDESEWEESDELERDTLDWESMFLAALRDSNITTQPNDA
jgi:hypothetical protein